MDPAPVDAIPPAWAAEALRQQGLLAAIDAGPTEGDATGHPGAFVGSAERVARGIAAYRANAHALAHRALAAALPTVEAMLGADELPALARAFWHAHPPTCGDIGEWGDALPGWLAARADLADWPWLPDAARLDLAVHRAERAADATLDTASFALLGEHDPACVQLLPMPGLALVVSAWPIVTMLEAHRALVAGHAAALAAVHRALEAGVRETALVCRRGWRVEVVAIDPDAALFTAQVLAGHDLAAALGRAGASFDFTAWLQQALAGGWLKCVAVCGD